MPAGCGASPRRPRGRRRRRRARPTATRRPGRPSATGTGRPEAARLERGRYGDERRDARRHRARAERADRPEGEGAGCDHRGGRAGGRQREPHGRRPRERAGGVPGEGGGGARHAEVARAAVRHRNGAHDRLDHVGRAREEAPPSHARVKCIPIARTSHAANTESSRSPTARTSRNTAAAHRAPAGAKGAPAPHTRDDDVTRP